MKTKFLPILFCAVVGLFVLTHVGSDKPSDSKPNRAQKIQAVPRVDFTNNLVQGEMEKLQPKPREIATGHNSFHYDEQLHRDVKPHQ
jgi:hypothetical protein